MLPDVTDAPTSTGTERRSTGPERPYTGGQPTMVGRRPPAVTILAAIQLLSGLAYGCVFLVLLLDGADLATALQGSGPTGDVAITVELDGLLVISGGFFVASTASGVLLLRMRQLGWTLTMLLTGIALAYGIFAWFSAGSSLTIVMLIQVVTVFYLNQRQVRQAFGISGGSAGPGRTGPRE